MVLYLCVLIVFSLHRESLRLILVMNPSPRWFCHIEHLVFIIWMAMNWLFFWNA
jgi:hypothetical protein